MKITFRPNLPIDEMRILALVQKNKNIKLASNDRLRIEREFADPKDRAGTCAMYCGPWGRR